jgi:hypothetical protein
MSSSYITLKEFGAGCEWHPKLLEYAKTRMDIFEKITAEDAKKLAANLGATFEDFVLYDTEWAVSFEPLSNLKILFLLVKDEEFGSEFYVFYNRSSVDKYPAEDALIFSLAYITLFPHEAEFQWTKKHRRLDTQIIEKRDINQMLGTLQNITPPLAKKVASKLGGEFNEITERWRIIFKPIAALPITYEVANKPRILYDVDKARWIPEVVYAFKWLYLKAVIREVREIGGIIHCQKPHPVNYEGAKS